MSARAGGRASGAGRGPLDLPLGGAGATFIEASAGTGKTHALTTLVARLLVEEGWRLDQILVVTFTRAASAELRDRIRRTVGAALAVLRPAPAAPPPADPQALALRARWEGEAGVDLAEAGRRLEAATHEVDRANVHTIHGFCRRVLADLSFESGFPFAFEVGGDENTMAAAAVRDFWRRRLHAASPTLARHAADARFLPRELTGWAAAWRVKSGVEVTGGDPLPEPLEAREAAWRGTFEAVRTQWARSGDDLRKELLCGKWLNKARYKRPRVETELAKIATLFAAPEPRLPEPALLGRYGRGRLSGACLKGCAVPGNPLFDALERLEEECGGLRSLYDRWLRRARRELLAELRGSIRRRVREERRLGYDDLLIELDHALAGERGAALADRIRREYPCALIDEYQDTDPVQARVFERIYVRGAAAGPAGGGGARGPAAGRESVPPAGREAPQGGPAAGRLFAVGDPKQSIYRFRGADVFAYLAARRSAREFLSLERNWRSTPALVRAVNALFAGVDPFVLPEIAYRPVRAARTGDNPLRVARDRGGRGAGTSSAAGPRGGAEEGALCFRLVPRTRPEGPLTKQDVHPVVVEATADEIVRLLRLAAAGEATIDGEPLGGGDLAVLVRTREQGRMVAEALHGRGVRSIEIGEGSVLDTREAEQIERFLWALAEPGREARLRGALAGDLFGLDARTLLHFGAGEGVWSTWTERFARWRSEWAESGIGVVLLRILEQERGAERLLRHRDGARRLTNVRHLAELLQEAETAQRLAPAELAAWLSHRRAEGGHAEDTVQLRLESDEQLVRILTVHGAKGLEFPVVFCPFAWDARAPDRERGGAGDAAYHLGEAEDYREVLDLHPDARAKARAGLEAFSESLRLLYVALTRAKYRCVVAWGQVRGAEHAPLAWLLHRGAGPETPAGASAGGPGAPDAGVAALAALAGRFKSLGARQWREEVEALARRAPGDVSVAWLGDADPAPPRALRPPPGGPPALAARAPRRPLRRVRALTSFTALSAGTWSAGRYAAGAGASPEAGADPDHPDHDQREAPGEGSDGDPAEDAAGAPRERNAFTFPRGPLAGSCLHRIFERLDEAPAGAAGDLDAICREGLDDFGIDRAWTPVARAMVERTRALRLCEAEPGEADRGGSGSPGAERDPRRAAPLPPRGAAGPGPEEGGAPAGGLGKGGDAVSIEDAAPGSGADPGRGVGRSGGAGPAGEAASGGGAGSADPSGRAASDARGGFRLADPLPRLVELEFCFPVEGFDRSRLAARLVEHGYPDPFASPGGKVAGEPPASPPSPPPPDPASAAPMEGFLRGFVDLVVEQRGRWYVIDYKSNWLGPAAGDYAPPALADAMRAGGYPLQYLIYLVALHRYLATRLPGYDYERHVGGAFYLFVRGIDPAAGMRRGVYFDRPSAACLHAVDACFGGGAA